MKFQGWCAVIAGILTTTAVAFLMLGMDKVWVASTFFLVPILVFIAGSGWVYSGTKHLLTVCMWGGLAVSEGICFFLLEQVGFPTKDILEVDLGDASLFISVSELFTGVGMLLLLYFIFAGLYVGMGTGEKKGT